MVSGVPPVGITQNERFLSCDTVPLWVRFVYSLYIGALVCLLLNLTAVGELCIVLFMILCAFICCAWEESRAFWRRLCENIYKVTSLTVRR
jgi:hypothetical protein